MTLRAFPREIADRRLSRDALPFARAALTSQADALRQLALRLDEDFSRAVQLLVACTGQVVVCGMGKSGLIGRKLSATLNCTGTRSFFLHPAEARHGDLARVSENDVVLLISNSGGTEEVVSLLPHFEELGLPMIALVGNRDSVLGRTSTVALSTHVERETCPHNFVPTTSALVSLGLGDALAMAAMNERGLTSDELLRCHPGGALGKRKTGRVRDKMLSDRLPLVSPQTGLLEALRVLTDGGCGLVVAVNKNREPLGIITDGDVRRVLSSMGGAVDKLTVAELMTHDPVTIGEDEHLDKAREKMHKLRLKALVVVNHLRRVAGVIEVFDSP
jgi:arabinose-5-phosphate isomerase